MSKFSNARIRAGFKDWIENNYEEYETAKAEAFREFFENETEGMKYDEMTLEWYVGLRDSFTFKDIDDWANDAYNNYVGDAIDHAYEEMKDRQIEEQQ